MRTIERISLLFLRLKDILYSPSEYLSNPERQRQHRIVLMVLDRIYRLARHFKSTGKLFLCDVPSFE
jgi:hypothetical protein